MRVTPSEVVTDKAPTHPRVLDEPMRSAWHHVEQYAKNRIEADHGRLSRAASASSGVKRCTHR